MTKATNSIMHGECFIVKRQIPAEAESKLKEVNGSYIVGHSESNHHHMVVSDKPMQVLDNDEQYDLYVRLFAPAKVEHKKSFDIHETQALEAGDYAVYHKQEYDPFADELRRVFD